MATHNYFCCTTEQDDEPKAIRNYEVTKGMPLVSAESETKYLTSCLNVIKPEDTPLQELLQYSAGFPLQFPVKPVLCSTLLKDQPDVSREILEHHINSAYPVLHEAALTLYIDFLEHKQKYGTTKEKALYAGMSVVDLVQRILEKRAVTFCGEMDSYVLLSGEMGMEGWEAIGTDKEKPPLVIANTISYDEIKLSAFLALSCYSVFINDGSRHNCGVPSPNLELLQRHGIVVGMVGARLNEGPVMEWHEVMVTEEQNVEKNGYGSGIHNNTEHHWRQMWAKFYGVKNLPTYKEVMRSRSDATVPERYVRLRKGIIFDSEIYAKRICVSAELLLLEAESRASSERKLAYVHVVGLGLGVWKVSGHQDKIFLNSFAMCLKSLHPVLHHVSDIDFAWFSENACGGVESGGFIGDDEHPIRIHFSRRTPHSRLDDSDKLLVVTYAWDGNSLPGNEFWTQSLSSSGDPANACSTQVSELQNPHVNQKNISGANLHIASSEWGVLHVAEYARRKLNRQK